MFINASFIDQFLQSNVALEQHWVVHSKYKNSFNIQDERKQQLVVITTTNYPFMPNGLYLKDMDFFQLLAKIQVGEPVTWQQNVLHFTNTYLFLEQATHYSSVMNNDGGLLKTSVDKLVSYTKTLTNRTGSQTTLADFLTASEPFGQAVQQLCVGESLQQQSGLAFLLGRGLGLTPSGDDMLVGHLAARMLLKKENRILMTNLTELLTAFSLTTDISKHYLLCALSGRFSEPVLNLCEQLTTNSEEEQVEAAVNAVIAVGHTSGMDLLAGFITTIKFLESK